MSWQHRLYPPRTPYAMSPRFAIRRAEWTGRPRPTQATCHTTNSTLLRGCLRSGRWLLPWISVLLVSVSLAAAATGAVTGAWHTVDGRSERARAAVSDPAPSGAAENADAAAQGLDLACVSRFTAHRASLSDAVRCCSTLAGGASATTLPGEQGDAPCELVVLYTGQNSWIPQRDGQCAAPLP
jgi:hypothetical protein